MLLFFCSDRCRGSVRGTGEWGIGTRGGALVDEGQAYSETGRRGPDTRTLDIEDGRFVYVAGADQAVEGQISTCEN